MTIYEAALKWVVQGFSVIPIRFMDKRPDAKLLPKNEIGDPTWEIYKTKLPTVDQIGRWFPSRLHNLGVVMGWNNLVVIDFDIWDVFEFWYQLYPLSTYMVKTKRGMHVYLQITNPVKNYHSELLDIKANGYVLAPPSIHPSGYEYQIYLDKPILKIENLLDVLPSEFTPEPENAITPNTESPKVELKHSDDPWDTAQQVMDLDVVDNIRKQVNLLQFFSHTEKKSNDGRWWVAPCPFHDDHNPSMWIDNKRGICGCYIGCTSKPLDVINLYARLHGLTNHDAIWALSRML
jgi:hypothetical protein